MTEFSDVRLTMMPLNNGIGHMPALGFGTLIPDPAVTRTATRDALEAGFRHFDRAERYRNESEVGEALQSGLAAEGIARGGIFVTTKLWNSNHRPERVEPAFEASLGKTPAQVLLAWAVQRGTAVLTTPKTAARARENFDISTLSEDAFNENNRIQIRQRLNDVVTTGSPGFIPRVGPASKPSSTRSSLWKTNKYVKC